MPTPAVAEAPAIGTKITVERFDVTHEDYAARKSGTVASFDSPAEAIAFIEAPKDEDNVSLAQANQRYSVTVPGKRKPTSLTQSVAMRAAGAIRGIKEHFKIG